MNKRLQVTLTDREYRIFQKIAKEAGVDLSEWVRQALRCTTEGFLHKTPESKLKAITMAHRHHFPTGKIDDILPRIKRISE